MLGMTAGKQRRAVGLGDPVVDAIVHVSADTLARLTSQAGGCSTINPDELRAMMDGVASPCSFVPGGSAANVMTALASMAQDVHCSFIGAVGDDDRATAFKEHLTTSNMACELATVPTAPTAVSLCMVTPDGQRTMRTCLGAAQQLRVQDLPVPAIQASDLLHCEGYCLYKADVLKAAVSAAKASNRLVSLDLASFEVVRNCKSTLIALLESQQIDIVICNEDEAAEMVSVLGVGQTDGTDALDAAEAALLQYCSITVFTLGALGVRASTRTGKATCPAKGVQAIDSVGAGDAFCGAFLAGLLCGASLQQCCRAGCAAGGEAVQCTGAQIPESTWQILRSQLKNTLAMTAAMEAQMEAPVNLQGWDTGAMFK